MIDGVRERAAALLRSGAVKVVVGYRAGRRARLPVPFFARTPDDAEGLTVNAHATGGLAVYARRETAGGAAAFVASRSDIRALKVLVQERQIQAERVFVIGYDCDMPGNPMGRMSMLDGERLDDFEGLAERAEGDSLAEELARLKAMTPRQRWAYWRGQFDKCVKCYACRAACPMCYCQECVTDGNLPQWVETSSRPRGNLSWHVVRAWHLAGRCVECGACVRACPEDIRLDLLNRMLADEVREAFGYAAGEGGGERAAVFASFREDDDEGFILGE